MSTAAHESQPQGTYVLTSLAAETLLAAFILIISSGLSYFWYRSAYPDSPANNFSGVVEVLGPEGISVDVQTISDAESSPGADHVWLLGSQSIASAKRHQGLWISVTVPPGTTDRSSVRISISGDAAMRSPDVAVTGNVLGDGRLPSSLAGVRHIEGEGSLEAIEVTHAARLHDAYRIEVIGEVQEPMVTSRGSQSVVAAPRCWASYRSCIVHGPALSAVESVIGADPPVDGNGKVEWKDPRTYVPSARVLDQQVAKREGAYLFQSGAALGIAGAAFLEMATRAPGMITSINGRNRNQKHRRRGVTESAESIVWNRDSKIYPKHHPMIVGSKWNEWKKRRQ